MAKTNKREEQGPYARSGQTSNREAWEAAEAERQRIKDKLKKERGGFWADLFPGDPGPGVIDPYEDFRDDLAMGGQLDLNMMTPSILMTVMRRQQRRRKGYSGTVLTSGLGVTETAGGRKTILGG